jgi:methanogenic corrinoid protein MtbC1
LTDLRERRYRAAMPRRRAGSLDVHPIQVVVRRTGLSQDVIRVWERRYSAVRPERTAGRRRLYTDAEIDRLLLLRRATLGGRSIGQVAGLASEELRRLIEQDEIAARQAPRIASPPGPAAGVEESRDEQPSGGAYLNRCLDAVRRLDEPELERVLSLANLTLSHIRLIDQVLLPFMRAVGAQWQEGSLRIVHEHLASAVVRNVLAGLLDAGEPSEDAPHLVVATPAGQAHEFGALAAVANGVSQGWRVTYLGANLPADEIAAAALDRRMRAVALSVIYPADDPKLPGDLRRLRRQLRQDIEILVGGPAASSYSETLAEIGARRLDDYAGLRAALDDIRRGPIIP